MTETLPQTRGKGTVGVRAAAAVLLIGAAVVLCDAIRIGGDTGFGPQQSGFFPLVVGVGLVVSALAFLVRGTFWPDKVLFAHAAEEHTHANWLRLWGALAALVLYAFLLEPLGYIPATFGFVVGVARLVGSRQLVRDVVVGLVFAVLAFFVFTEFFGVRLPSGVLAPVL